MDRGLAPSFNAAEQYANLRGPWGILREGLRPRQSKAMQALTPAADVLEGIPDAELHDILDLAKYGSNWGKLLEECSKCPAVAVALPDPRRFTPLHQIVWWDDTDVVIQVLSKVLDLCRRARLDLGPIHTRGGKSLLEVAGKMLPRWVDYTSFIHQIVKKIPLQNKFTFYGRF